MVRVSRWRAVDDLNAYARGLELGLKARRAELAVQWKALRRGWYAGGERFAEKLRGRIQRRLAGRRRESHSGGAKREHGEGGD
jgi:hypothetical protein